MSLGVSWGHTSGEACVRRIIFSELSNSSSSHEATLGHARSFLRNRNKQSLSLSCPPSWLSYSTVSDVCSGWMRPWTFFCSILALWSQGPEPLWILTVSSCHHLFVSDWDHFFKCDSPRGETTGFTHVKLDDTLNKVQPPNFKGAKLIFKKIKWLVHPPDAGIDIHFTLECLKSWWSWLIGFLNYNVCWVNLFLF